MSHILQLSPYTPECINSDLEAVAPVIRYWDLGNPQVLPAELAKDVTVVATKGDLGVPPALMASLPNLKLISVYGVGYDAIDLNEARRRSIAITTTPDSLTSAVADMAIALILAGSRRLVEGDHFVRAGNWANGKLGTGFDIRGKTVGIFGYGRIGKKIARILEAFDCNILYCDLKPDADHPAGFCATLEELAEKSRVLVISAAGGAATRGMVNLNVLSRLGPDGLLINVARGSIVNQEDLIKALQNGAVGGACLDVFEQEPNVPEPLVSAKNVILTPHISSATLETRRHMGEVVIQNIAAWLEGKPLVTPLQL
ncbi:2-hydroxyacid dehydrogenase [Pseudovibrio sp. SPO723]|uniref:2-hydroxyacid dehydrogenase n=1 Tax=Nesiotobacter zosterae TaxID=392721 RepID=UPI0029C4BFA8|nr:2-hydroxyacid dehydrogenase [Pseudovibrio sp. SPO723]MDX5595530.1 2-hydroxyacid dehydrogenase [Pseudovibrio sp. SPO723]